MELVICDFFFYIVKNIRFVKCLKSIAKFGDNNVSRDNLSKKKLWIDLCIVIKNRALLFIEKKKCAEGDHISLNMIKYSFKLKYSSQRKNIECNEIIKLIS